MVVVVVVGMKKMGRDEWAFYTRGDVADWLTAPRDGRCGSRIRGPRMMGFFGGIPPRSRWGRRRWTEVFRIRTGSRAPPTHSSTPARSNSGDESDPEIVSLVVSRYSTENNCTLDYGGIRLQLEGKGKCRMPSIVF